jgi:hypothetical protein
MWAAISEEAVASVARNIFIRMYSSVAEGWLFFNKKA